MTTRLSSSLTNKDYPTKENPDVKREFSTDAECLLFVFDNLWITNTLDELLKFFVSTEAFSLLVQRSTSDDKNMQPYVYVNRISCEINHRKCLERNRKMIPAEKTGVNNSVSHKFTFNTFQGLHFNSQDSEAIYEKSVTLKQAKFIEFEMLERKILLIVDGSPLSKSIILLVTPFEADKQQLNRMLTFLHNEQRLNPSPKCNKLYEKSGFKLSLFRAYLPSIKVLTNIFSSHNAPDGWSKTIFNRPIVNEQIDKKKFDNFVQTVITHSFFTDLKNIILKEKELRSLMKIPYQDYPHTTFSRISSDARKLSETWSKSQRDKLIEWLRNNDESKEPKMKTKKRKSETLEPETDLTPETNSDDRQQYVSSLINLLEKNISNHSVGTSSAFKNLRAELKNSNMKINHSESELKRQRESIIKLSTKNIDQTDELKTEKIKSLDSEASNSFKDKLIETLKFQIEMEKAKSKAMSNVANVMKTEFSKEKNKFVKEKKHLIETHEAELKAEVDLRVKDSSMIDEMTSFFNKCAKRPKLDTEMVDLTKKN